jgi:hypothetical protein
LTLLRSVATLQSELDNRIERGDLNSALHLIHRTVDQVFCEAINTAQIFGSSLLDDYCQDIGSINWRKRRKPWQLSHNLDKSKSTVVYIVSRLYDFGGHTPIIADLIRLGPRSKSVILITGTVGKTDISSVQHRFAGLTEVSILCAPRATHLRKLDWLQQKLQELSPEIVWLFNHVQDSVAVSAVQPNAGYELRFYHHGDHQLCLGVHLEYAVHIDPHPMGFHNCRDKLGVRGNRYLPLTVKDLGGSQAKTVGISNNILVTCTAASSNKIEAPYFIRYSDVIPRMLKASGGRHIHIGPLNPLTLWKIRRGLRKLGVSEDQFLQIPYVKSVWSTLHDQGVNLYIGSFPYGGGRTLIEAMGAGIPVCLHLHSHSRLLCSFDMAYEGAMYWRKPQELYDYVSRISVESLMKQAQASRRKYEDCYREELLADALSDWAHPLAPPPLLTGYSPDILQVALDVTNQVSFVGTLRRVFCRALRRLKSAQI